MNFSKRYGFEMEKSIQVYDIDLELRTSLQNIIYLYFFKDNLYRPIDFFEPMWLMILKKDISVIDDFRGNDYKFELFKEEFSILEWFKVYNLIELILETYKSSRKDLLIEDFNSVLKMENSAYRIVNEIVVPITDEIEIKEIEQVFQIEDKFKPVKDQIRNALKLLSDKENPDYKNSFKESISAVESLCKIILGEDNITLGQALRKIENDNNFEINGALKSAFSSIYGFASNEVRHGRIQEDEIDYDLAKFLLVACCAFINYLISINKEWI